MPDKADIDHRVAVHFPGDVLVTLPEPDLQGPVPKFSNNWYISTGTAQDVQAAWEELRAGSIRSRYILCEPWKMNSPSLY